MQNEEFLSVKSVKSVVQFLFKPVCRICVNLRDLRAIPDSVAAGRVAVQSSRITQSQKDLQSTVSPRKSKVRGMIVKGMGKNVVMCQSWMVGRAVPIESGRYLFPRRHRRITKRLQFYSPDNHSPDCSPASSILHPRLGCGLPRSAFYAFSMQKRLRGGPRQHTSANGFAAVPGPGRSPRPEQQ